MPLGYPNYSSSDATKVGATYTRLRGPILVGNKMESTAFAAAPAIVANVSTGFMDYVPGTTSIFISTGATTGFTYLVACTGTVANIEGMSTPNTYGYIGVVPVMWSVVSSSLCIYSTTLQSWMVWQSGSSGTGFTTS